ncbi:hypothetical protein CFP65_7387 [Kitasatospora sp. MMS16-BH015]|nr:hypothetical protein CFP65_7387 [Kitasatospora sp. MMS16-BH015]
MVERLSFPRAHVGEALTPASWPLLEVLGVRAAVQAAVRTAGFRAVTETQVSWVDRRPRTVRLPPGAPGLTVCRARFDQLLLAAARSAGALVLQPATARRPRRTAAGWEVPLRAGGAQATLRARFLVDASGRGFALGGVKQPSGPRLLALHGRWQGVPEQGPAGRVAAGPDAWCWGALLPDGDFRAMAFTDPATLRRSGRAALEHLYRGLIADSGLLAGLPAAHPVGGVSVCDASSYADPAPVTTDSIKIGEAAFAIDPLSSSGVDKALQTAMAAAITVHTLLTSRQDPYIAMDFYLRSQQQAVRQHADWAAHHYHEHRLHRSRPFWQHRARVPPEPPAVPSSQLSPDRHLRLVPSAILTALPCAVGDRVELRRALTHPNLPRPVAYLDGIELAPLIDLLVDPRRPAELVRLWSRHLTVDRAVTLVDRLHRLGVLDHA